MTGLLEEHIAVVTGSGSGIGRAIALGYASEGAQVAVLDIDGNAAAETVKAIIAAGGKAFSFMLDVTERDKCRVVATQIGEKIGRVSILGAAPPRAAARARPPAPAAADQGSDR